MPIEVRETTVTAGVDYDVVELHISDAEPGDEEASFVLRIHAQIAPMQTPTLAHLQRAVMEDARNALSSLLQQLASELNQAKYNLHADRRIPPPERGSTESIEDN